MFVLHFDTDKPSKDLLLSKIHLALQVVYARDPDSSPVLQRLYSMDTDSCLVLQLQLLRCFVLQICLVLQVRLVLQTNILVNLIHV